MPDFSWFIIVCGHILSSIHSNVYLPPLFKFGHWMSLGDCFCPILLDFRIILTRCSIYMLRIFATSNRLGWQVKILRVHIQICFGIPISVIIIIRISDCILITHSPREADLVRNSERGWLPASSEFACSLKNSAMRAYRILLDWFNFNFHPCFDIKFKSKKKIHISQR